MAQDPCGTSHCATKEQKDGLCSNLYCNLSTHIRRHCLNVLSEVTANFLEAIGLSPSLGHTSWSERINMSSKIEQDGKNPGNFS